MSEISRLLDQLHRDHSGDPWHGTAVGDILRGVTGDEAAARVAPHVHTVWELVRHMTAWKREVHKRLIGGAATEPEDGDWPAVGPITSERWTKALGELDAAHVALMEAVRELAESRLFEPTNDPRDRPRHGRHSLRAVARSGPARRLPCRPARPAPQDGSVSRAPPVRLIARGRALGDPVVSGSIGSPALPTLLHPPHSARADSPDLTSSARCSRSVRANSPPIATSSS